MRYLFFGITILMVLLPDIYIYFSKVHLAFSSDRAKRVGKIAFFLQFILQFGGAMLATYLVNKTGDRTLLTNSLQAMAWTIIFVKLFVVIPILLFGDAYRIIEYLIKWFSGAEALPERVASRRTFIKKASVMVAAVPFLAFLHGMTRGKYNFQVRKVQLAFKDLPKAFDGFKLAQFSDFHAGSFDSVEAVREGLHLMQEQQSDLIVFTGDLVNSMADEMDPYVDEFKILDAPYGQYACTGNHDYGYRGQESRTPENKQAIKDQYGKCNLTLLNNDYVKLEKDGEHICLMGVENWGAARHFPKKGKLNETLENIPDNDFKILLSHDPTHWDAQVKDHNKKVHLTLSGHTHGAQMGVELLGIKWSPGKYVYKKWAGIYEHLDQYLYVNRGFGMLGGFAFRTGMNPEITVFELKKG